MFKIKKKIIKNELEYKGAVILKYEIEYPQVYSIHYDTKKFNDFNLSKVIKLENYAKNTYDYNVSQGFPVMIYELVLKTYVTYNQEPFLSLYQDEYTFTGSAHGSTIRTSQNWNFEYGFQISLSDIFYDNPNYILCILKDINKQISEKGADNYFDDYCSLILDTFNLSQFYLNPYSVIVYFQQYDIAPYSSGIPTFEVSLTTNLLFIS